MRPLMAIGASSARYMGTTALNTPAATPIKNRPAMRTATWGAAAMSTEPKMTTMLLWRPLHFHWQEELHTLLLLLLLHLEYYLKRLG